MSKYEFTLFDRQNGETVQVKYREAWLLVDNGYLAWSCTVPPIKLSTTMDKIRFSKWLESLRKDVECTFGIMKGRFRVLKSGIRLHGVEAADKVWMTCCALHNMLLEFDGLEDDDNWARDWGHFEDEDVREAVPFAIQCLGNTEVRGYDTSGMGRGGDADGSEGKEEDDASIEQVDNRPEDQQLRECVDGEGFRCIRHLSLQVFRSKLIEHFDIQFKRKQLKWPQSNASY